MDYIGKEIQEAWAELIIEKPLNDLLTVEGDGYFKISDGVYVYVENTDSITLIKDWLTDRIGVSSAVSEYSYPEEVETLKVEWVIIDKTNNETVWYYDNECGDMGSPLEVIVNNTQDAYAFLDTVNSGWGGHISTIKVIETTGNNIKVLVGEELVKANYRYWDSCIDEVFDNLEAYPELCDLLSDEPEDAG